MKIRKMLVMVIAIVLMFANTETVFAEGELTTPGESSTSESGEGQYLDQVKYRVTLPTEGNLSFVMDPEGYYGYFSDDENDATVAVADLADYQGKILSADVTKAATIKNESSVPIVITCKFDIDSTATGVTYGSSVTDPDEKQIALGIMPCTYSVVEEVDTYTQVTANAQYVTSTDSTSPTSVLLALDKAAYVFSSADDDYTYTLDADTSDNFQPAYFQVGGAIAKDADWSELVADEASIALHCVYSFIGATSISEATVANGVVTGGAELIEYIDTTPEVVVPTCILMNATNTATITGESLATDVITIKVEGAILDTANAELTSVTVDGVENTITKGNNSTTGVLWFKLAEGTTLTSGVVVNVTIGESIYTCTLD